MKKTTLNKVNDLLEKAINELKMEKIEDKACDRESGEMTEKEEERYGELEDEIDSIQSMVDDIENARASLYDF